MFKYTCILCMYIYIYTYLVEQDVEMILQKGDKKN